MDMLVENIYTFHLSGVRIRVWAKEQTSRQLIGEYLSRHPLSQPCGAAGDLKSWILQSARDLHADINAIEFVVESSEQGQVVYINWP